MRYSHIDLEHLQKSVQFILRDAGATVKLTSTPIDDFSTTATILISMRPVNVPAIQSLQITVPIRDRELVHHMVTAAAQELFTMMKTFDERIKQIIKHAEVT